MITFIFLHYGISKFEDFELIVTLVFKFMNIQLHFFGLSFSIYELIMYAILLSIVFSFIRQIFIHS